MHQVMILSLTDHKMRIHEARQSLLDGIQGILKGSCGDAGQGQHVGVLLHPHSARHLSAPRPKYPKAPSIPIKYINKPKRKDVGTASTPMYVPYGPWSKLHIEILTAL